MPLEGIQFSRSELTKCVALAFWSVVLLLCIASEEGSITITVAGVLFGCQRFDSVRNPVARHIICGGSVSLILA